MHAGNFVFWVAGGIPGLLLLHFGSQLVRDYAGALPIRGGRRDALPHFAPVP